MNEKLTIYCCAIMYFNISIALYPEEMLQGELTTLRGKNYPINKVTYANGHSCMQVYKAPTNTDLIIPKLAYNPKEFPIHIKLIDVKEISIVYPYATWVYKHKRKDKYLLIEISWHNPHKKKLLCLIEPKKRLSCELRKKSTYSSHKIPFSGIKKISLASQPTQN